MSPRTPIGKIYRCYGHCRCHDSFFVSRFSKPALPLPAPDVGALLLLLPFFWLLAYPTYVMPYSFAYKFDSWRNSISNVDEAIFVHHRNIFMLLYVDWPIFYCPPKKKMNTLCAKNKTSKTLQSQFCVPTIKNSDI